MVDVGPVSGKQLFIFFAKHMQNTCSLNGNEKWTPGFQDAEEMQSKCRHDIHIQVRISIRFDIITKLNTNTKMLI